MCIKPLRNTVPENLHIRISSPHLDSLHIHAPILDESVLTTNTLCDLTHSSTTWKCEEIWDQTPSKLNHNKGFYAAVPLIC